MVCQAWWGLVLWVDLKTQNLSNPAVLSKGPVSVYLSGEGTEDIGEIRWFSGEDQSQSEEYKGGVL